jgi:hypothetical protein
VLLLLLNRCRVAATVGAAALLGVSAAGCSGDGAEGGCPLIAACGGDPTGVWQVQRACQYTPTTPSQPLNYQQYITQPMDPVVAAVQPLATTAGDWCSSLFYPAPGMIVNVTLWHGPATLQTGTVAFNSNPNSYKTSLVYEALEQSTHFAPPCLQTGGFAASCMQLQTDLLKFYTNAKGQKYDNLTCAQATDGGCDCNYTYEVDIVDQGTWAAQSNGTLLEASEPSLYTYNGIQIAELQPTVPVPITYCAPRTGGLTLSGSNGTSLSGVLGLRTLVLTQ